MDIASTLISCDIHDVIYRGGEPMFNPPLINDVVDIGLLLSHLPQSLSAYLILIEHRGAAIASSAVPYLSVSLSKNLISPMQSSRRAAASEFQPPSMVALSSFINSSTVTVNFSKIYTPHPMRLETQGGAFPYKSVNRWQRCFFATEIMRHGIVCLSLRIVCLEYYVMQGTRQFGQRWGRG